MTTLNFAGVTTKLGGQMVVHLMDERTGSREIPGTNGVTWELRITADEAPSVLGELISAYSAMMQRALVQVAAGNCRTCGGSLRVDRDALADLGGLETGRPCPVCVPRAESRIRRVLRLRPKEPV